MHWCSNISAKPFHLEVSTNALISSLTPMHSMQIMISVQFCTAAAEWTMSHMMTVHGKKPSHFQTVPQMTESSLTTWKRWSNSAMCLLVMIASQQATGTVRKLLVSQYAESSSKMTALSSHTMASLKTGAVFLSVLVEFRWFWIFGVPFRMLNFIPRFKVLVGFVQLPIREPWSNPPSRAGRRHRQRG